MLTTNLGGANLGGGAYNGISVKQSMNNTRDSEYASVRRILRSSWNGNGAAGEFGENKRIITPFRAVMNTGDFLGRQYYVCGGAAEVHTKRAGLSRMLSPLQQNCDNTGVPGGASNGKFVSDSSLYTRFRKERAMNQNYNENGYNGFINDSFVPLMRVRRHR